LPAENRFSGDVVPSSSPFNGMVLRVASSSEQATVRRRTLHDRFGLMRSVVAGVEPYPCAQLSADPFDRGAAQASLSAQAIKDARR
jgi:hypothetical protein